jgi:hypothetical protein
MSVKGYLVFVPFENIATMQYGNNGAPDRVTVATTPGHLAGPFEVHQTVQDPAAMAMALRSAVKAGAIREQEAIGHLMSTCAASPEEAAGLIAGTDREPCEDHDDSLRACCGTRQLGPHAQDCRLSATMQAGMLDHERMYSHETEVRDG